MNMLPKDTRLHHEAKRPQVAMQRGTSPSVEPGPSERNHQMQPRLNKTTMSNIEDCPDSPKSSSSCQINISDVSDVIGGKKDLIQRLGLQDFYPRKIGHVIVMGGSEQFAPEGEKFKQIPIVLLKRILMQHPDARDTTCADCREDDTQPSGFSITDLNFSFNTSQPARSQGWCPHPMDTLLLCYVCSTLRLRRVIMSKLFMNKVAIPLIIPEQDLLEISLYSLQSIALNWRDSTGNIRDEPASTATLPIVSFLRLSETRNLSKSHLLNTILKCGNTFFSRNCPLGDVRRTVSNGLIEAAWYLPSEEESKLLTRAILFLNLRGEACPDSGQIELLGRISSLVVILLSVEELSSQTLRKLYDQLVTDSDPKFLIILTDHNGTEQTQFNQFITNFGQAVNKFQFVSASRGKPTIPLQFKTELDIKEEVARSIEKILESSSVTLTKYEDICDEAVNSCTKIRFVTDGKRHANINKAVLDAKRISILSDSLDKTEQFALQGKWNEWANLEKQHKKVIDESVEIEILERMKACRQDQINTMSGKTPELMKCLITAIERYNATNDSECFPVFIESLQHELNQKMCRTLMELQDDYTQKLNSFHTTRTDESRIAVSNAEKNVANAMLGVEHFFREMGQAFEASRHFNAHDIKLSLDPKQFPDLMAKLVFKGIPLEIMDGDASCVPLSWLEAVFNRLEQMAGSESKILVVSVLGVQSSGKSTLLNFMLGLQFPVGVGRCTKGVYGQLIPVEKDTAKHKGLSYDYILVVDTEGLRGMETQDGTFHRDNEIATLVVGISDIVIVNIKGENFADMQDIIQIVVHAFLRMNLVDKQRQRLKKCFFVHHNVDAIDAKQKMKPAIKKLQSALDKATIEAAKLEGKLDIHKISEVLDCNWEKDVFTFCSLLKGSPPMCVPNPGYCKNIATVKNRIFSSKASRRQNLLCLSDLLTRIKDIWAGIISDNFVFAFRNSLEVKTFTVLDRKIRQHSYDLENYAIRQVWEYAQKTLSQCATPAALDACEHDIRLKLEDEIRKKAAVHNQEIHNYCQQNTAYVHSGTSAYLDKSVQVIIDRFLRNLVSLKEQRWAEIMAVEIQSDQKKDIYTLTARLARELQGRGVYLEEAELKKEFEPIWQKWKHQPSTNTKMTRTSIRNEVMKRLEEHFKNHLSLLRTEKDKQNKNLIPEKLTGCFRPEMLEEGDIEHYKGFFVKQLWDKAKHPNVHACKIINEALYQNELYLKNLQKADTRFFDMYTDKLIMTITEALTQYNEKQKKRPFTFLPQCLIKVTLLSCRFAIPVFETIQASYETKHGVQAKMAHYKAVLFSFFKTIARSKEMELGLPAIICGGIEATVISSTECQTSLAIQSEINANFPTKLHLIFDIHRDLASREQFDDYMHFFQNPRDFAIAWIKRHTDDKYFKRTGQYGRTRYCEHALKYVTEMFLKLKRIVETLQMKSDQRQENIPLRGWIKDFCSCCQQEKIYIPAQSFAHVSEDICIMNMFSFLNALQIELKEQKARLESMFDLVSQDTVSWGPIDIFSDVLTSIWGCDAICPICREPCHHSNPGHSKSLHLCCEHRPLAVIGVLHGDPTSTHELSKYSCHYVKSIHRKNKLPLYRVVMNRGYGHRNPEVELYWNPEDSDPDWDIPTKLFTTNYWLWFLNRFAGQLSQHFNMPEPSLSESERKISKEQALNDLLDLLYLKPV